MNGYILSVEDDEAMAGAIKEVLEAESYEVVTAPTLFRAEGLLNKSIPALILLDRMLPDGDGFDLCRKIKAKDEWKGIPILFLSDRRTVKDKVRGLDLGGDDYLAKPFDPKELVSRVKVIFRRGAALEAPKTFLSSGDLRLDASMIQASLKGAPLDLWPKEFELLRLFIERRGHVLDRPTLLKAVWGYDKELTLGSKTVDVTISRLRKKLGDYGEKIVSVKNYGYRFDGD
jgi:DNA-binding response OmpR family regulator